MLCATSVSSSTRLCRRNDRNLPSVWSQQVVRKSRTGVVANDSPNSDIEPSLIGKSRSHYVRPEKQTYAPPSIKDTGTLRPSAEWFPAWMKYRSREDNYVFWMDKFNRNSAAISCELPCILAHACVVNGINPCGWHQRDDKPIGVNVCLAGYEKRWTVFSTLWYTVMQLRFFAVPPALRFLIYLGWRAVMSQAYQAHKALVLWRECNGVFLGSGHLLVGLVHNGAR